MSKLSKLEAFRGLCALYVVVGHTVKDGFIIAGHNLSFLLKFGQEAVIVFFLLSGFVIEYSFSRSKDKTFKTYFSKRFLRIYFPLAIVLILNYIIVCIQQHQSVPVDYKQLAGNLFMLQDVGLLKTHVIVDPFLGNLPLWSLSYEWWFYMLYFVIQSRFKDNSSNAMYVLAIIGAGSLLIYPNFASRIFAYMLIWWCGVAIARLYLKEELELKKLAKPLVALAICIGILAINVVVNKAKIGKELGYSTIGVSPFLELRHFVCAFVIIIFAFLWRKFHWKFFNVLIAPFEPVSKISYVLYISHYFLLADATYLSGVISNTFLRYAAYVLICLVFSYILELKIYKVVHKAVFS